VLAGPTHVSRVGVSLLSNLGTPEWVGHSGEEYVEIARKLASGLPALAACRAGLRDKMRDSPISDGLRGARALESAFRQMWSDWCASR
jgi:predicted O-linked N-acetylglucosamine transferase (SPINDLY family)